MGILDELNKTVSGSVSRVMFEARKLQKATALQGELFELRHQFDKQISQLGKQAFELAQQGRLAAPELSTLTNTLAGIKAALDAKQRELDGIQSEPFVESAGPPQAQRVPIDEETATTSTLACPRCGTAHAPTAMFCPSCGARVAA